MNGGIHNLPFFRASSKHVAGSISSGVCFDSHPGLFFRGTISSTKVISGDWTWQFNTLGSFCELAQLQRAGSAPSSSLKHIAQLRGIELAQWHRAGSIVSTKNKEEKKRQKNWASYVTLSWRTNVRASKRILTMYWPGSCRIGEPAQGHVAGSISARCFFFFFAKEIEPAMRHWASYVALSQQGSFELWASKEALSQQGSFELWASKEALSQQGSFELHHIYTYAIPTI